MSKAKAKTELNPSTEEGQEEFEPVWGIDEYCQNMGIKKSTVFSQMSRNVDMPPYFKVGSITKWRPEAVREWIKRKEQEKRKRNFEE